MSSSDPRSLLSGPAIPPPPPPGTAEEGELHSTQPAAGVQPPPDEFYRGFDGAIHKKPPKLYWRLMALRKKTNGSITTVTVIVSCIGGAIAQIGALWVYIGVSFGGLPYQAFFTGSSAVEQAVTALGIAAVILAIAGLVALLAFWAHRTAKGAFMRSYTRALTLIRDTPLALVVADDQYWLNIFEMQREIPWLKWGVTAPPKTIEQHLEFAAAYHSALLQLARRFGRLEPKLISRGNFLWHAGQPACYFCGAGSCVIGWPLFALGPCGFSGCLTSALYLWYAASALLAKNGMLAAFCDFFLGEADFSLCPEILPDDGPVGI